MASYSGNIDLLSLSGAQVFTGIDPKDPKRAYVCIPIDVNEIKLATARNNAERQLATFRVNIWPLNEQYKNAVRRSSAERGDASVSEPTHEMQQSYSTEYIKAVAMHFPKLVEQVREQHKERDPDIVNQDAQDENSHLFKALRNRMNRRIAMLYQPRTATAPIQTPTPPSMQTAGQPTTFDAAASEAQGEYGWSENFNDDDLPF